ncbi:unnamed protein product, partial [Adineta steineri]
DWSSNDEIIPIDHTENVNVQFEGSSDEENNFDDFDVSDDEETIIDDTIQEIRVNKTNDSIQRSQTLQPRTIDALWLQRNLNNINPKIKAQQVLTILDEASNNHELENKLILLLGCEHVQFIKLLRTHRQM